MKEQIERVKKSYGRCLAKGDVIGRFYEIFLQCSPLVQEKFKNTDFDKQKKLLRLGVTYMIMYANGDYAGQSSLNNLRKTHSHKQLNIEPELYTFWKESLIKTIGEFDSQFSLSLRNDWEEVINLGISHIKGGYHENH